jgi:antibiotic biosynthesis monooxygenase (ABM) superfamily enzyme
VSVAITGFLLIPWASKLLNWWLVPPEVAASRRTRQGALVVVGLYAVSVILFAVLIARYPQLLP